MNCNLPTAAQEREINGYEWLIRHFADLIFEQDWAAIDAYASESPQLTGVQFYEWLAEIWTDRRAAICVLAGANLHQHALECAHDYVDYLLSDWL